MQLGNLGWSACSAVALSVLLAGACTSSTTGGAANADNAAGAANAAGTSTETGGSSPGGAGDGGAGAQPEPAAPQFTTAALPESVLNVRYISQLDAQGGSGKGYVFAVSEGQLPPGVTLSKTGLLTGRPTEAGAFTFVVTVKDSGGGSSSREFTLSVQAKRWLVYQATVSDPLRPLLFAVDVLGALQQRAIGNHDEASFAERGFRFSPDGSKLAFLSDPTGGYDSRLYVVNMTGIEPGQPGKVSEDYVVRAFTWSPDGRWLVFRDGDGAARVVDMTSSEPSKPQLVTDASGGEELVWGGPRKLVYIVQGAGFSASLYGAELSATGAGTPGQFPVTVDSGPTAYVDLLGHPGLGKVDVLLSDPGGAYGHIVVDFRAGKVNARTPRLSAQSLNRDLTYVAGSSEGRVLIHKIGPGEDLAPTELPGATWSLNWLHGKDLLAVATHNGRAALAKPGSKELAEVPGTYGQIADSRAWHSIAPDDDWLAFYTESAEAAVRDSLWIAPINGASPGEARRVNVPVPDAGTDAMRDHLFSPSGQWIAFAGEMEKSGRTELYLSAPGGESAPLKLNKMAAAYQFQDTYDVKYRTGSRVGVPYGETPAFGWSADSRVVAFVVREDGPNEYLAKERLYVVNVEDRVEQNANALAPYGGALVCNDGGYSNSCSRVIGFEFQP